MNFNFMDTGNIFIILGPIAAILGLGLAVYGISTWLKRSKNFSTRLDQFVTSPLDSTSISNTNRIIPREISGSLFSRTISSWFNNLIPHVGKFTPEKMGVDVEHKLTIAGNPANLHAGGFIAIRFLLFLAGVIFAVLINRDFKNINTTSLLLGILIIVMCLILPGFWLKSRVRARQFEISRGMPDALDMLSVCASAGLGFDQSLQKISSYWDTELGHELKRVIQEMEMGVTRSTALRNMSDRLDVDDLSSFIAIIIQAEKIGMSYAEVLHGQALQMRMLRQYRAREMANKLPAKMIIPVALFIFPALMAVILGPAIPIVINLF